jgi:hypothetical protein
MVYRISACQCVELDAGSDESAWGAVPALLLVRFPRPLAEPAVRVSTQRALHGPCRGLVHAACAQGLGIWFPR